MLLLLEKTGDFLGQLGHALGVAPFVVVPDEEFKLGAADDHGAVSCAARCSESVEKAFLMPILNYLGEA